MVFWLSLGSVIMPTIIFHLFCRAENEAKLILWWGKVLELTLRQISFNADHQMVLEVLLAFTPALGTLGEDKSSSGLWGAIGLGKKSPLSQRYCNDYTMYGDFFGLGCRTK